MLSELEKQALALRNFGSIDLARKIVGDEDLKAQGALGFILEQNRAALAEQLFGELLDTHRNLKWDRFKSLVTDNGFTVLKQWRFPYKIGWEPDARIAQPQAIIAADLKRKLLMNATSYISKGNQEVLNGGEIHGAIKLSDEDWLSVNKNVQASCRFDNGAWHFDMDILEGIFTRLRLIEEVGGKFVKWQARNHVINLGDYPNLRVDELTGREDIRKRRREIKQLLSLYPDVRAFIR